MIKNWMWLLLVVILVVAWYGWKTNIPASNTIVNDGVNSTTNLSTKSSQPAGISTEIIQSAINSQLAVDGDAGEATLVNSMSQWVGDLNQSYNETTF